MLGVVTMGDSRDHYIGDEMQKALRLLDEESDEFELRGRYHGEVDCTFSYGGGNYLHVEEHETEGNPDDE